MGGRGRWLIATGVVVGVFLAASIAASSVTAAAPTGVDASAAASTGVCREAEILDSAGDPGQDIRWAWASRPRCEDLWQIAVRVFLPFFHDSDGYANMRFFGAEMDTDANAATGCRGADHRVEHDGSVGRVFRTPSCDTATWSVTSSARLYFNNHSTTDAFMQWPASSIGDPAGPVGFRAYIIDTRGRADTAPDSGFFVVPPGTKAYDADGPEGTIYRLYRGTSCASPTAAASTTGWACTEAAIP